VEVHCKTSENQQQISGFEHGFKTRMIAGLHVSLWPPSALSVCLALTHAVLSKISWLADRELVLHVDNAREFHSEALVRGGQEYGIRLDHRPAGLLDWNTARKGLSTARSKNYHRTTLSCDLRGGISSATKTTTCLCSAHVPGAPTPILMCVDIVRRATALL
jgi:hypothetical protein